MLAGALCQAITQSHCLTDNPCGSGLARECGVSFKAMLPDTPTSRASPLPQGCQRDQDRNPPSTFSETPVV
ncbi:hypothetical protein FE275_16835 [Pseudomonas koreensis]|nr:hypothetical protein FE275_16835 [Pseudomonas koreensis]QBR31652.1 hypothetical protein E3Z29_14395 [Pseudomonas sp. S150]